MTFRDYERAALRSYRKRAIRKRYGMPVRDRLALAGAVLFTFAIGFAAGVLL